MAKIKTVDKTNSTNTRREILLQKLLDDLLSTFIPENRKYDDVELYCIVYNLFRGKYDFSYNDYKWIVRHFLDKASKIQNTNEVKPIQLNFEEGKHYKTKFATGEGFTITKLITNSKGIVTTCFGMYDTGPNFECPLPIERLRN